MTLLFQRSPGEERSRSGVVVRGEPHASHAWRDGVCRGCGMRTEWAGSRKPCTFRFASSWKLDGHVTRAARKAGAPRPPPTAEQREARCAKDRVRAQAKRDAKMAARAALLAELPWLVDARLLLTALRLGTRLEKLKAKDRERHRKMRGKAGT